MGRRCGLEPETAENPEARLALAHGWLAEIPAPTSIAASGGHRMVTYHVIGRPTRRVDGAEKATGHARYAADVSLPGTLWGR
jgi:hypothetical protein